jgi:hypothetical protein
MDFRSLIQSLDNINEDSKVHKGTYGNKHGKEDVRDQYGHKIGKIDKDTDDNASKEAPKKGRGRPKKGADDSGEVKKYDSSALSVAFGGGKKPSKEVGKKSVKHSLKDWIEDVAYGKDTLSESGPGAVSTMGTNTSGGTISSTGTNNSAGQDPNMMKQVDNVVKGLKNKVHLPVNDINKVEKGIATTISGQKMDGATMKATGGLGAELLDIISKSENPNEILNPLAKASQQQMQAQQMQAKQSQNSPVQPMHENEMDEGELSFMEDDTEHEGHDPSEYDMEGDFVKTQLHTIARSTRELEEKIRDQENLPEWVEMKISQAQGMLASVADYIESEGERDIEHETGEEGIVSEKAVSKAQQKFFGMVHAMQKGKKITGASKELKGVAKDIGKKDAKDFASTKHKGLPQHVKKTNETSFEEQGVVEGEKTMSRAAKGNEKYGKDGMKALAKAGRDGASEKKLDAIRDKHDNYNEGWSQKYKSSINCSHPKGFSQKAHCAGKKKHNEDITMEAVCPDCGMCKTHGNVMEIKKGAKDSNGFTKCWPGHHAAGTKKGKNGGQVRNCVPNESQGVAEGSDDDFEEWGAQDPKDEMYGVGDAYKRGIQDYRKFMQTKAKPSNPYSYTKQARQADNWEKGFEDGRYKQDVAEGAPIVVMPSHKRLEKKHKPSLSRGMDPAKAQGEQDARDGKPYNNPYPFKKELGAPGNWEHNSYKASYDSVKQGVAEGSDEGKPGKNFAKIAKAAGKRYGSKAAGERVAGAVRAKLAKQGKLEESTKMKKLTEGAMKDILTNFYDEVQSHMGDGSIFDIKKARNVQQVEELLTSLVKHGDQYSSLDVASQNEIVMQTLKYLAHEKELPFNALNSSTSSRFSQQPKSSSFAPQHTATPSKVFNKPETTSSGFLSTLRKPATFNEGNDMKDKQFESWERELNGLLNEGITVSHSTGQQGSPDSLSINATEHDATELMSILRNSGMEMFGGTKDQQVDGYGAPQAGEEGGEEFHQGTEIAPSPEVVGAGDDMLELIKKMSGIQSDQNTPGSVEVDYEPEGGEEQDSGKEYSSDDKEQQDSEDSEDSGDEEDKEETDEGNAFTGKLAHTKKGDNFKMGDKTYKDTSSLEEDDMEEGNAFTEKLAKTKQGDSFDMNGHQYTDHSHIEEGHEDCMECGMPMMECECDQIEEGHEDCMECGMPMMECECDQIEEGFANDAGGDAMGDTELMQLKELLAMGNDMHRVKRDNTVGNPTKVAFESQIHDWKKLSGIK